MVKIGAFRSSDEGRARRRDLRRPSPHRYLGRFTEAQRANARASRAPESFPFFGVPCLLMFAVYGDPPENRFDFANKFQDKLE